MSLQELHSVRQLTALDARKGDEVFSSYSAVGSKCAAQLVVAYGFYPQVSRQTCVRACVL